MGTISTKLESIRNEMAEQRPDLNLDRFGHFHFTRDGNRFRIKFQKTSVRFESYIDDRWVNLVSATQKDIYLKAFGKLVVGQFVL